MKIRYRASAVAIVALFSIVSNSIAQPPYFDDSNNGSLGIEFLRPSFGIYSGAGSTSSYSIITDVGFRISERAKLLFEIPYTRSKFSSVDHGDTRQSALGNILFGVRAGSLSSPAYFEGSMRLPTSPERKGSALINGMYTDITRIDAFIQDWIIIKGIFGYRSLKESGLTGRFRLGPSFWLDSSNEDFSIGRDDSEFLFNYSGHLWYKGDNVGAGFGLSGLKVLTEDNLLFKGSSALILDCGMSFRSNRAEPGLFFHFPLTIDLDNMLDYVVSLDIEFHLN